MYIGKVKELFCMYGIKRLENNIRNKEKPIYVPSYIAEQFHHRWKKKNEFKQSRCAPTHESWEYNECDKWGHFKDNRNYKETIDKKQKVIAEIFLNT